MNKSPFSLATVAIRLQLFHHHSPPPRYHYHHSEHHFINYKSWFIVRRLHSTLSTRSIATQWIAVKKTNHTVHFIVRYLVDSIMILPFEQPGPVI